MQGRIYSPSVLSFMKWQPGNGHSPEKLPQMLHAAVLVILRDQFGN